MPPKNDICVASKKFFIICKDSQRTWQTIFTIIYYCVQHFTTCIYMNMQITGMLIIMFIYIMYRSILEYVVYYHSLMVSLIKNQCARL